MILTCIRPEYVPMCKSIHSYLHEEYFEKFSSAIAVGVAVSNVVLLLNRYLKQHCGAEILPSDLREEIVPEDHMVVTLGDNSKAVLKYVKANNLTAVAIERELMQYECDKVYLVLPHQQPGYVLNQRYIIDKILTDGILNKCSDVHLEPVYDKDKGFVYTLKYRQGIYLSPEIKTYNLTTQLVTDMLSDMVQNRSNASYKATNLLVDTATPFRLADPLYHVRCEVFKTIFGVGVVIRFLPQSAGMRVKTLGFDDTTNYDLTSLASITSGLSLVSGVIGSGKGTTLNAIALEIEDHGKYSVLSIDSPTEFLGRYSQIEYLSPKHLSDASNAVKKMDRNFVFLNEIATQETAREVYNMVVSGVHVLTSVHCNRVYRVVYKLQEMLGDLYTNLIPFLNFVSYQDKFSKTCACRTSIYRDYYTPESNEAKLLKYLGLETIMQPAGCEACNHTGINKQGLQIVSEHLFFTSKLKDELLRVGIHEQSTILRRALASSINLEDVYRKKLQTGEIMISEVVAKLDTWRED